MLVSIITVCYNSEQTIERTLKSVFSQSYSNIEYIIIDGNSTDNTCGIIKNHKDKISYFSSEPDTGIYDAMNKGIKASTGDYIIFLNSDDWFHPKAIKTYIEAITKTKSDYCYGPVKVINPKTNDSFISKPQNLNQKYFFEMPISHITFMCKKSLLLKHQLFDLNFKIAADYDLFYKIFMQSKQSVKIEETLVFADMGGVTSNRSLLSEFLQISIKHSIPIHNPFIYLNHIWATVKWWIRKFVPLKILLKISSFINSRHSNSN